MNFRLVRGETFVVNGYVNGQETSVDVLSLGSPNSISSVTATESAASGGNNVVTITQSNGTTTSFNVKNGIDGQDGQDGADGVSLGEVALVQTTGSGTDVVMSQNAVTEYGRKVTTEDLDGTSEWIRAKLTEEGWAFGKYVKINGALADNANYCATTFIPVSGISGHRLTYCYMYNNNTATSICFYDSNKSFISGAYAYCNADNLRTVDIGTTTGWNSVAYVRMTLNASKLDECYLKDNTTDEYIFKAENDIMDVCNENDLFR